MATFYSDQYVSYAQAVPVAKLLTTDLAGRLRIARFSYTAPASSMPGANDLVYLTALPWKARVFFTFFGSDAQVVNAVANFGETTTATRWGTVTVSNSTYANVVFPTKSDYTTAVPTTIPTAASGAAITIPNMLPFILKWTTAGMAASAVIYGAVFYAVD